jgi:anti-sigma-K factor RskA
MSADDVTGARDPHALTAAYALGTLAPDEVQPAREHIASCAECTDELPSLLATAATLGGATAADPPPQLRTRLLERVAADARTTTAPVASLPTAPTSRRGSAWLAVAAAVVLVIVAGAAGYVLGHRTATSSAAGSLAAVAAQPDVRIVDAAVPGSSGWVVWSAHGDEGVYLVAGLPAAPAGHVYQMWLRQPGGALRGAGFVPPGTGTATLQGSVASADGFGVTVEPTGGSQQPTTQPLVLTPLH